jgi:uncharacterized protein YcbX
LNPRIAGLWGYPVKSMRGQALTEAVVEVRGLAEDRLYAVRDDAGKFGSGKNTRRFARMDGLALWSARRSDERVEVRPPNGDWLDAASREVADLLTAQIGRSVAIVQEEQVSHFDAAPVHIVTTGDLDYLHKLSGARPPAESFRPNIMVETRDASWDWVGRRLRIHDTELEIVAPTERCLMVNVQPDGVQGPDFLRPLAQHVHACLGVYAAVSQPGRVRLGDVVVFDL